MSLAISRSFSDSLCRLGEIKKGTKIMGLVTRASITDQAEPTPSCGQTSPYLAVKTLFNEHRSVITLRVLV